MNKSLLSTEITYLKGVGPKKAELLQKELDIFTYEDLLMHFPFRYVDRSKIYKIADIGQTDQVYIQLAGTIKNIHEVKGRGRRLIAKFADDTGILELVWFRSIPWMKKYLQPSQSYIIFGKVTSFRDKLNMVHPEIDFFNPEKLKSLNYLQPVYSSTEKLKNSGLDSRGILKLTRQLISEVHEQIHENLPEPLKKSLHLIDRRTAFVKIHFPDDEQLMAKARNRLKFEELFFNQFNLVQQKLFRTQKIEGHIFEQVGAHFNQFYKEKLPFDLTGAQKKVIKEIRADLKDGHQMNRLLQGDVGSGKTVVALLVILLAIDNGFQAALMAPTEILATQHYNTISRMLKGLGVRVSLLTGSTKQSMRKQMHRLLDQGELQILVGTHAILEEKVTFDKLGLVVIDEQHRFGVAQRAKLWLKNKIPPHVLVMTATPIPRTLAMTLYGDLDVSMIDELPPGRKPIKTMHSFEKQRLKVFGFLKQQIKEGRQVYIVYPLIEESEKMDYHNLQAGYETICRDFPKPDYQVSIVHGRMKAEEKEFEMQRFKKGETQIMVSTTVIEVGVDVPNATIMVIESAERFGLSQLHQLRGRVGRSDHQSYCILMTGYKLSQEARTRMETMVRTNNGFEIAEVDLNLRGPGEMAGTKQSGTIDLKIANLAEDHKILKAARYTVQQLLNDDPEFAKPENLVLKHYLDKKDKQSLSWSMIS